MASFAESMKSMGNARTAIVLAIAGVLLVVFIVLSLRVSTGSMVPLYTNLSLEDSAKIVGELEKMGVNYELQGNGSQISVSSERVLRLRMSMAESGLPSGGSVVGYEIFDRSETFGNSSFVLNVNMMRALEGELARTIGSLADVELARVHLVLPKREIFTREKEKPSASVTIKMRGSHVLEHSEVNAIMHLVASAVPGLDAAKVTIVDNHGRLLARGDGGDGFDAAATSAQEFRTAFEMRTQQKLEDLIEKVIGAGKVRVQVAADLNFDRVVTNSEKYDPDGQVARSTQSNNEKETSQDKTGKDAVTVSNNIPPNPTTGSDGVTTSSHNSEKNDETTNFEISKTVQNHVSEGGNLAKISVAVLVDGNYTKDTDGKSVYAPRTDDELKQLKTLVTSAIGYDEKRGDKIEVVNMRFTQDGLDTIPESFFDRFKGEMQSIIQTLIIALVAILAILLVFRPAINQLVKQGQTPSDRLAEELESLQIPGAEIARLPGGDDEQKEDEGLISVANVKGGLKSSSMRNVTEIVEKYPEETMGVLRQWILKPAA